MPKTFHKKSKPTAAKPKKPLRDDIISEDEVDAFHESRNQVLLDSDPDQSEDFSDEEVLAMDDLASDDEDVDFDDEDVQRALSKMPGLKKRMGALEAEEEEEEAEEDDIDAMAWGHRKSMYYNDDADYDEEAAKEEEAEALRLQKERAAQMTETDFLDDFQDAMGSSSSAAQHAKRSLTDDQRLVQDFNEELEKIELNGQDASLPETLAHLSKQEILDHIASESPELLELLAEFKSKVDEVTQQVLPLLERAKQGNVPMSSGLSFLELKNQLLLSYCLNLAFYFYLKADGKRVKDHPVIGKLVQLRLYLEKMKPIEQKLKYQIDKLVKMAATGQTQHHDVLSLRANPANLMVQDSATTAAIDNDSEDETGGVYKAPRIAPVHYDEEPDADIRRRKAAERARRHASGSRLMQDLMAEVTDMPEEVVDAGNMLVDASRKDREWEERIRAEEEMMVRLPVSRKDKKKMRERSKFANELENLDDFGDLAYMDRLDGNEDIGAEDATSKKKSIRSVIRNGLGEEQQKKRKQGGDDDLPYRDAKAARYNMPTAGEDYNTHLDDDAHDRGLDMDAVEDDYYLEAKEAKSKRKHERKEAFQQQLEASFAGDENGLAEGDKRQINYDIMKNKGLTPVRKKEQRNPRLKHRMKYEQSLKKLKSFKAVARSQDKAYGGEETGIKKNLARSVKF